MQHGLDQSRYAALVQGLTCSLGGSAGLASDLLHELEVQLVGKLELRCRVTSLATSGLDDGRVVALGNHAQGLVDDGADDAGGVETAGVGNDNRNLADCNSEVQRSGEDCRIGVVAGDDLNQLHLVHRGEEVQADEVLLTLDVGSQLGDRKGGGVGAQDAGLRNCSLDLGVNLVLEVGVLEDGLDDQVDIGQIVVGLGRLDAVQQCCGLLLSGATALESLGLQALGVGLAALGVLQGNVLQDNFHASLCTHVCNTCAHHAGADNGNLLELALRVRGAVSLQRTGAAALSVVEVEEERLHHVLRLGTGDQLGEVAGLDTQCGVDVDLRALDGSLHRKARSLHRGALELLGQVCREGRQVHCELRSLRVATRNLEALLIPWLCGLGIFAGQPCSGSVNELLRSNNLVNETSCESLARVHLSAGQNDLHQRVLNAQHANDAGDTAAARQEAEGDLWQANLGTAGIGSNAVVSSQRDLEAAAQCCAVDGGNNRHRELLQATQRGLHILDHVEHVSCIVLSGLGHLLDVAACEEGLLRRGDDDALDGGLRAVANFVFQALHGGADVVLESLVHGVDRRIRVIHGEGDDSGVVLIPPEHVICAHKSVSPLWLSRCDRGNCRCEFRSGLL